MRSFWKNHEADVNMILTAVVMAIVFAISIAVIYNVMGSFSFTTLDTQYNTAMGYTTDQLANCTNAANASDNILTNLDTFYTLGPIAITIVAAVGIIGYVMLIRGRD